MKMRIEFSRNVEIDTHVNVAKRLMTGILRVYQLDSQQTPTTKSITTAVDIARDEKFSQKNSRKQKYSQ